MNLSRLVATTVAMAATLMLMPTNGARAADPAAAAAGELPISEAEKKIFLDEHFDGIGAAHVLRYHYRQSGSLDQPFDGPVVLTIKPKRSGRRAVDVSYLDGAHKVLLPAVDDAKANPVILYFLEQDVRDMHRRLGGSENYFRRRIRLAFAEGAQLRPASVELGGKMVEATEVVIRPFVGDPMKGKLGPYENKTYAFAMSDRVPGQVLRLRSSVTGDAPGPAASTGEAPLLEDVLMFENAAR
ncbi:MAG: hypothetical protein ABI277_19200 [Burkholderiaceae bacterium]